MELRPLTFLVEILPNIAQILENVVVSFYSEVFSFALLLSVSGILVSFLQN